MRNKSLLNRGSVISDDLDNNEAVTDQSYHACSMLDNKEKNSTGF